MLCFYLALIDDVKDQEKFQMIYDKYRLLMIYTAKNIFNDNRLAEEAVQEAFIKIARVVGQIEDIDSHKTKNFTVIITRNTCLDILDKENRHRGLVNFDDVVNVSPSVNVEMQIIENKELLDIIKELPEEDRNVILLKYYYEFSEKEISALLGISYDASRKRLQRARKKLEKPLEKWRRQ